jgi:hypothetical protein
MRICIKNVVDAYGPLILREIMPDELVVNIIRTFHHLWGSYAGELLNRCQILHSLYVGR